MIRNHLIQYFCDPIQNPFFSVQIEWFVVSIFCIFSPTSLFDLFFTCFLIFFWKMLFCYEFSYESNEYFYVFAQKPTCASTQMHCLQSRVLQYSKQNVQFYRRFPIKNLYLAHKKHWKSAKMIWICRNSGLVYTLLEVQHTHCRARSGWKWAELDGRKEEKRAYSVEVVVLLVVLLVSAELRVECQQKSDNWLKICYLTKKIFLDAFPVPWRVFSASFFSLNFVGAFPDGLRNSLCSKICWRISSAPIKI